MLDEAALLTLYESTAERLHRYVVRRVGADTAQDVVSAAFPGAVGPARQAGLRAGRRETVAEDQPADQGSLKKGTVRQSYAVVGSLGACP